MLKNSVRVVCDWGDPVWLRWSNVTEVIQFDKNNLDESSKHLFVCPRIMPLFQTFAFHISVNQNARW